MLIGYGESSKKKWLIVGDLMQFQQLGAYLRQQQLYSVPWKFCPDKCIALMMVTYGQVPNAQWEPGVSSGQTQETTMAPVICKSYDNVSMG